MNQTNALTPDEVSLVLQEHGNTCGIACVAMIAGVSYREACDRLAPPPSSPELAAAYLQRQSCGPRWLIPAALAAVTTVFHTVQEEIR